ncbi:AI-2E family transporter [Paeniroseomonas aquatica]|uniref:AI-2E family transporter n=1 Tax=Paeniroseomonas aquatica TaxID=373043 RepID=A0ABT8AGX4_9PROT|nr:AI-2E family transporter [Paeniroseomonas aquatica]MDN3568604.1 AI-2E family transporter [Paeniroseomonas aquatica]
MLSVDAKRPAAESEPAPAILGSALSGHGLAALFASAVVIAGLYLGRELLVPLVLAILLAFVLAPLVRLFRRIRIGNSLAVLLSVGLGFAAIFGIGVVVTGQVTQLAARLPEYQRNIAAKVEALRIGELLEEGNALLERFRHGLGRKDVAVAAAPAPAPAGSEASALDVVSNVAEPLLAPLATIGIVFVFVVFVLLYREDLRDRLIRLAGARDLHRTTLALNDAAYRLSRFFLAQVALNAGFGLFIAGGLWLIGLPNPVLWGILAGLMRFVPFIGTFIAVVPPALLALAVDPTWALAIWVLGLFLISEPVMGQVVEPLLYGHSTGLSPLAVIVAATFWAFLWGPVGLLLATPLTVCLVVLGRHVSQLEFLDVALGDRPPLRPEETFYQRALEGDAEGLLDQAKRRLRDEPVEAYYDEVVLRGLALAEADWAAEVLASDRLERINQAVGDLLAGLALPAPAAPRAGGAWRAEGAVLCIAGRGAFDGLAAQVMMRALQQRGFGALALPNNALETGNLQALQAHAARFCLISAIEAGSSAVGLRYMQRRIRRTMPEGQLAIGLWGARPGSEMLLALSEGKGQAIVTSLREALALAEALAEAPAPAPAVPQPVAD